MTLHVRETGSREGARGPVLFIHGFPFDGSMWSHQLAALPDAWRGLAPDLRGFGESALEATPGELPTGRTHGRGVARDDEPVLTMDRHADDLADLLARRGGEPAVVCGLSMGGYVAFALLRRHPGLVRALVLADTRAGADTAEGLENRRAAAALARESGSAAVADSSLPKLLSDRTFEDRAEVVRRVRGMIEATAPESITAGQAGMAERADSAGDLPAIAVPTLVVVGEDDALTPPSYARELASAIPDAALAVVPAAGHLSPLENPEPFNRALVEFLASL